MRFTCTIPWYCPPIWLIYVHVNTSCHHESWHSMAIRRIMFDLWIRAQVLNFESIHSISGIVSLKSSLNGLPFPSLIRNNSENLKASDGFCTVETTLYYNRCGTFSIYFFNFEKHLERKGVKLLLKHILTKQINLLSFQKVSLKYKHCFRTNSLWWNCNIKKKRSIQ